MPPPSSPRARDHELAAADRSAGLQRDALHRLAEMAAPYARTSPPRSPALAGANGASATPCAASHPAQAPSEPSRAQLAPPSASTVTVGAAPRAGPVGRVEGAAIAVPAGPAPAGRDLHAQPSSRASQARSSGEAFIATGKHPPVEPVKNSWPSPRPRPAPRRGRSAASIGAQPARRPRHRRRGKPRTARPWSGSAPTCPPSAACARPRASPRPPRTRAPGARQHLGRHQPRGPRADHQCVDRRSRATRVYPRAMPHAAATPCPMAMR